VINAIRVFTVQENASDFLVTNIKTVIEAAVNVTQGFMLQTSVQFTVEDIPDDLYINCRPGQLANALILLIQHARRAVLSNDIRIVRLTTHRPNDATIELRVAHNGTKIPSEMLPHLFQTVPDSDAPIPAEFAGFASVAQIVMDHQAEVGVVEDAELTRFFIRLPLKPNQ
jgi:signal transduction histidine kinase